jgi:iron complex outermembrane receptor protein
MQSRLALLATTAAIFVAMPVFASAQTVASAPTASAVSTAAPASDQIEAVVVTARKRSEDILKIPGSVSAFTAKGLEDRGIVTMNDIANFTPGVTDDQAAASRTDRSFQSIIIRGMNPSSAAIPTTSIFINGTAVGSSAMIQNINDAERVEVLKGPQSAYFGRETFAGAVNIITKQPTNTLHGSFSITEGTRNTQNYTGDISGPIIADKLMVDVGGSYDTHDGSYRNAYNSNQTLGDQSTKSVHFGLTAKPIDNLTIKLYAMEFQDKDGPAATGLLLGSGAYGQGNCTVNSLTYFCGTLPGINSSVSPAQNTTLTTSINKFLANPGGILSSSDTVKGFGLKRDASHADMNIQYDIPNYGLTLTYLASYNEEKWSELSDLSSLDGGAGAQYPTYTGYAYYVEHSSHDYSQEARIATDASKPYRLLFGVSYVDSYLNSDLGSAVNGVALTSNGITDSKTSGVYFSLAYDVLKNFTVNFDGRYQEDEESAYTAAGALTAEGKTYNFLPRVSAQYRFTPDVMAYFTYSKGVNPGPFNSQYALYSDTTKAALATLGYNASIAVKPEEITNYELGLKGRFFDGRATLSADIYYDQWKNQLNSESYTFAPGQTGNPSSTSIFIASFTDNTASSTPKGIEAEANFIPITHVTVNVSGAYNDTKYDTFNCTSCLPYASYDAKGKYLPNSPVGSYTVGAAYANTFELLGAQNDWYARVDYIYRDGFYFQPSNTAKTPDSKVVNLRGGINFQGGVSVEGFVNNLTNEKAYTSAFQGYNFSNFSSNAVGLGLPQLITGGVKLKYKF